MTGLGTGIELECGALFADRYRIDRRLGRGGMGEVYLATDTVLDNAIVALKLLQPELSGDEQLAKRFLREVQLTREVTHPNVVRTYEAGKHCGQLFFTMEYVDGQILSDLLQAGRIEPYETSLILLQLCNGLAAIHEQGIIHRDLKPANIMLTRRAVIKIADFGIARPRLSDLTHPDELIGSEHYMAPELWAGAEIVPATDLYAVGALAYELLTGLKPFIGDRQVEVMFKHCKVLPLAPSELQEDVPDWLNDLILNLLQKQACDRIASARAVAAIVEDGIWRLRAAAGDVSLARSDDNSGIADPILADYLKPASIVPLLRFDSASSTLVEVQDNNADGGTVVSRQRIVVSCTTVLMLLGLTGLFYWLFGALSGFSHSLWGEMTAETGVVSKTIALILPSLLLSMLAGVPFFWLSKAVSPIVESGRLYLRALGSGLMIAMICFSIHLASMWLGSTQAQPVITRQAIKVAVGKSFSDTASVLLLAPQQPVRAVQIDPTRPRPSALQQIVIATYQPILVFLYLLFVYELIDSSLLSVRPEWRLARYILPALGAAIFVVERELIGDASTSTALADYGASLAIGPFKYDLHGGSLFVTAGNWILFLGFVARFALRSKRPRQRSQSSERDNRLTTA